MPCLAWATTHRPRQMTPPTRSWRAVPAHADALIWPGAGGLAGWSGDAARITGCRGASSAAAGYRALPLPGSVWYCSRASTATRGKPLDHCVTELRSQDEADDLADGDTEAASVLCGDLLTQLGPGRGGEDHRPDHGGARRRGGAAHRSGAGGTMFGSRASAAAGFRADDVLSLSSVLIAVADQADRIWRGVSGPIGFLVGAALPRRPRSLAISDEAL
jgi:hypothetical protein